MADDSYSVDWSEGSSLVSGEELQDYLTSLEEIDASEEAKIEMIYHHASVCWYLICLWYGVDPHSLATADAPVDKSTKCALKGEIDTVDMVKSGHAKTDERQCNV